MQMADDHNEVMMPVLSLFARVPAIRLFEPMSAHH